MELDFLGLLRDKKLLVAIIIILVLASVSMPRLGSVGIITGYQGLEPSFNSVYFKNHLYTDTTSMNPNYVDSDGAWHIVSASDFYDHVNFDPDTNNRLYPNLKASMQPVTVDAEYAPKTYSWQIYAGSTTEGSKVYDVYRQFQIQEFRCTWKMNLWLDGDYEEAYGDEAHTYMDAQLWIKLTPKNFVYYADNPEQLFFAPVYIGLSENAIWRSGEYDPNAGAIDYEMAGLQDIFPEAKGEVMGIFHSRLGTETNVENSILEFQGTELDPNVFRDEYWIRVGVERFGAKAWRDIWGTKYHKYPSAQLNFQINIFVVGEWKIKLETGDVPDLDPRIPYYVYQDWLWQIGNLFGNFVTSPFTYIWLIAIVVIIYFVAKIVGNVSLKSATGGAI